MYSKEYDNNLRISKIHYKRKADENVKNVENRYENKKFRKILTIGSIISISILLMSMPATAVTEIGSWGYNSVLTIPPNKELINNLWGAPYEERQSGSLKSYIYYKSDYSGFGWEWSRSNPIPSGGWVQPIFPEVIMESNTGFSPIKLRDVNSLSAELRYKYPKSPTGDYNLAYDIWFTYYNTKKAEIMVWISCTAECTPGTYAGEINDGYNTYEVYYTNPSSWRPWLYYAFILKDQSPIQYNHTVNIKALLNSISGKLNSDWSLSRLDIGNEIWRGSGRIEISKYKINLNVPTTIKVISPDGGEYWKRNTKRIINWKSTGSPGGYVSIELFKGGTLNRIISSRTDNDNSYNWTIPYNQTVGADYKIKIKSVSNYVYADTSNQSFSIVNN